MVLSINERRYFLMFRRENGGFLHYIAMPSSYSNHATKSDTYYLFLKKKKKTKSDTKSL